MNRLTASTTRTLLTLTIALAASMALAQAPRATAMRVFDRIVASEVPCSATTLTRDFAASYDRAFCGYIADTMTDVNTSWTTEEYQAHGYGNYVPWIPNGDLFADGIVWMAPYSRSDWDSLAVLLVGYDSTAIILTFDRR